MENVKAFGVRLWGLALAILLASGLAVSVSTVALPDTAYADANQAVLDQRQGVFKFNWGIDGHEYARGSAFLINEEYIVTAYHCVRPSSTELAYYESEFGITQKNISKRSTYTITLTGGFQREAKLDNWSEEQDMAILKLTEKVPSSAGTPLKFRDSSTVEASETVYALGFPVSGDQNAVTTFTSNDVAVTSGTIIKPEGQMIYLTDTLQECSGTFLSSSCQMEGGSSGGPMVDENGAVIGICVASDSSSYYASSSDILMQALDQLGYTYEAFDGGASDYELNKVALDRAIANAANYESEVADELSAANDAKQLELENPKDESEYKEKQSQIDSAAKALNDAISEIEAQQKETSSTEVVPDNNSNAFPLIPVIIAIVAVAVIAVVAVVLLRARKKKGTTASTGGPDPQLMLTPPVAPPVDPGKGGGAGETSILGVDGNETDTIVLFKAAEGGSLTRMSTNEQIPISSAEFTVGRDKSKVSYCPENNDSISRIHARFVVRDGNTYIIDNGSANGTYVNSVKARKGQEIRLNNGDIITLADEKFRYSK